MKKILLTISFMMAVAIATSAQCNTCYGYGYVTRTQRCITCGGRGSFVTTVEHTCHSCNGRGSIQNRCSSCNGSGAITETCSSCRGTGAITESRGKCSNCNGQGWYYTVKNGEVTGTTECRQCYGTGTRKVTVSCQSCNGRGTVRGACHSCGGSGVVERTCSSCYGRGSQSATETRTCNTCSGTGTVDQKITCPTCHGSLKQN